MTERQLMEPRDAALLLRLAKQADRLVMAIILAIPLAGILAGFGGWAVIGISTMTGSDGSGLGNFLLGLFMTIFFGGVSLAAIAAYIGILCAAPWRKTDQKAGG